MTRREQRIRIMTCIYQYLLTGKDIDDIFSENLDMEDRESISYIVNNTVGVLNNLDELIAQIEPFLTDYQFDRLGYLEQSILLMSANELNQKEIDRPVIINEAIEIAKKYCDKDAPKFINGVLDNL
ncbi:MAG: transcription antitermination factor NusB [Erysipelotrichaceae bacterium]|nr:transcription antitermination factor NusB [Erysipelotrichaceae bacterium]